MYRIFIVDDESWILERLVTTIDWESIDVEVVGKAVNGAEAIEQLKEQKIDILLTDIRMPKMNGLDLIREVKRHQNLIKSIIISGYSDFEYARQAISEGVFDYITKPVEDEELLEKVGRCCKELEREREIRIRAGEKERIGKKNRDMLQKQYLGKLLTGDDIEDISSQDLAEVGICDSLFSYICLGIAFENTAKNKDLSFCMFIIENILSDLCAGYGHSYCTQRDLDVLMCVIGMKEKGEAEKKVKTITEALLVAVNRILNIDISIGIGKACESIYMIDQSRKEADIALQNRYFFGGRSVYHAEEKLFIAGEKKLEYEDNTHIVNYVKAGMKEKAIEECCFYIERLRLFNPNIRPIDLKILFQDFIFTVSERCFNSEKTRRTIYNSDYFKKIQNVRNIETLKEAMIDSICFLYRKILLPGQEVRKQTIEIVLRYIKEHYREKIALEDAAGMVYLNTSYFCKIFKEEMGESFVNYLLRYRMKKASEYLEDSSLKIYEVAELVGYSDVQYFTKIYKKIHGIAPKEYRTNLILKKKE